MEGLIGTIIVGIAAGFIASKLTSGEGKGCWINLFLGLVGAIVGGVVPKEYIKPTQQGLEESRSEPQRSAQSSFSGLLRGSRNKIR